MFVAVIRNASRNLLFDFLLDGDALFRSGLHQLSVKGG
jgi:hypothetical protein